MGCIPLQRVLSSSGECQEKTNKLAQMFNTETILLVSELSSTLANATFKFGDAYDVVNNVIANPNNYGFSNSDSPCCSFGKIRPALTCIPASTLCKDRSKYVFWD
ncbi:GDSL esterase/lipase [Forsythia ovata]|uniref:GDSL esterase/lipase n=1 Tax=Forsythia ovata TaxID=205694 RepID=A0ABD1R557_9LAMI